MGSFFDALQEELKVKSTCFIDKITLWLVQRVTEHIMKVASFSEITLLQNTPK